MIKKIILLWFVLLIGISSNAAIVRWGSPEAGSPPAYYYVEIVDEFGQTVYTSTTVDTFMFINYEGIIRASIKAVDSIGRESPYSNWSNFYMSPRQIEMWSLTGTRVGVGALPYLTNFAQVIYELWIDPHESN